MYTLQIIFVALFCGFQTAHGIESRIFGGEDLRFEVHKYLVKLKIHNRNSSGRCSGSILDNYWIITSAHCFNRDVQNVTVYHQVEDNVRVIAKVDKKNIIVFPGYKFGVDLISNRKSDIALMKTTSSIKFSDYVQPVKVSNRYPKIGQSAIIAGYGDAEEDKLTPREGAVAVKPCPYNVIGLICSEDIVRAGAGDSGGSLLADGRLIGVTSASCKDVAKPKPCLTVYVNVAYKFEWIQSVVST